MLAIAISILFFWVIKDFVLAVFLAAILAGLLHPSYRWFLKWTGGRKSLASAITVVLSLVLVIAPLMLFLGLVVSEAAKVSESARQWLTAREASLQTCKSGSWTIRTSSNFSSTRTRSSQKAMNSRPERVLGWPRDWRKG